METWSEYTRFTVGLLALVDPFTSIPLFLALTAHLTSNGRIKAALAAAVTVTITLLLFQYTGESVVEALGSSLPSFQIAGGIVIAIVGLQMLAMTPMPEVDVEDEVTGQSGTHIGIVPIGIPMLGGAGAIAKVIVESHESAGIEHQGIISLIILGLGVTVAIAYCAAGPIGRVLGTAGLLVINRLAGMIVLAIAVEMVIEGITTHPGL
ncbi:MAG: MarC family protein [Pseudomonadota bacterium]